MNGLESLHNRIGIDEPDLLIKPIAGYLGQGSLGLFLGAGASMGLGLPNWDTLVDTCVANAKVSSRGVNEANTRIMDRVEGSIAGNPGVGSDPKYRLLVRDALYKAYDPSLLMKQDLLIALGALMMGSKRGSVSEVFTLNFDDVIERYLKIHGFAAQVVLEGGQLRRNVDVTMYHPHGYLPYLQEIDTFSRKLVFSQMSYDAFAADPAFDVWVEMVKGFLSRRITLFIGLSTSDQLWGSRLMAAKIARGPAHSNNPLGFWFFGPDAVESDFAWCIDRGVFPIKLPSYARYPDYLLDICRAAANSMDL